MRACVCVRDAHRDGMALSFSFCPSVRLPACLPACLCQVRWCLALPTAGLPVRVCRCTSSYPQCSRYLGAGGCVACLGFISVRHGETSWPAAVGVGAFLCAGAGVH